MSRKKKYRTEKERKAAHREACKRWQEKKKNATPAATDYESRLDKLEKDFKEVLLSLDECLKENKRISDLVKWGKK